MKRLLAFFCAFVMLFGLVACADQTPNEEPQPDTSQLLSDLTDNKTPEDSSPSSENSTPSDESDENTIDIYIIAGQSNAVGHTQITSASTLYANTTELQKGYSHVHYAGDARSDANNYTTLNHNRRFWCPVTLNLGKKEGFMGPEVGIAEALSAYYNEESGKHAGIIKLAHGDTSLLNSNVRSNVFGNWVSPSYAERLGIDNTDPTGGLYRALLAEIKTRLEELPDYGDYHFTKVNIKGIYWMQGEHDYGKPDAYKIAMEYFVSDLRSDLSDMMKRLYKTDDDCGASQMPFVVGTISETFGTANPSDANKKKAFITMQKSLPNTIDRCYVVDNSQYAVNVWNSSTQSDTRVGSDQYHWNQNDMFEIGYHVGQKFLEIGKQGNQ